jgi:hypothetical protein
MIPGTQFYAAVCFRFLHPFDLAVIACPSPIMSSTNTIIQRNRMTRRVGTHQPQEEESIIIPKKKNASAAKEIRFLWRSRSGVHGQAPSERPTSHVLFARRNVADHQSLSEGEKHLIAKAEDEERYLFGLEHHFLNETYKQKQKLKAVLAVLMEQIDSTRKKVISLQ